MRRYTDILTKLADSGNLRSIPADSTARTDLLDFSTNDYLGLATRTDLQEEFYAQEGALTIPLTSSASRLLASTQRHYEELENLLTDLYGRPSLLFNSGYHANTGLISALAEGSTLILADRLVHASIIDGMVLSKARFMRFRHNDVAHLEQLLRRNAAEYDRVLIVVESVYSMDGDTSPLEEIAALRHSTPNALLYVDEAHAVGVCGPTGLGVCHGTSWYDDVDILVGTFGKACASMGAFCAVSDKSLRDFALNRSRSFIFSTALPPLNAAWTSFILRHIVEMNEERTHLQELSAQLASSLAPILPAQLPPSHILPVIVGSADKALALSRSLLDHDIKVLPIRTPTVPPGTERLRISLSAGMSSADITRLSSALTSLHNSSL